jgi:hypothetical protein
MEFVHLDKYHSEEPPAKAPLLVTPAETGVGISGIYWIPAFAGMTEEAI